jgi:hypothetical protein
MKTKVWLFALILVWLQACGEACQSPCKPEVEYPNPGACPIPGADETEPGGECGWFSLWSICHDNSTCVSNTCIPCGNPNQICCTYGDACSSGTCEHPSGTHKRCSLDCGQAGQPCCEGNECDIAAGLVCNINTHTCVASGSICGTGANSYGVGVINKGDRCGDVYAIQADNPSDAKACVEEAVGLEWEIAPAGAELKEYTFCNDSDFDPPTTLTKQAYSSQDAKTCAHNDCTNCTTTANACPNSN